MVFRLYIVLWLRRKVGQLKDQTKKEEKMEKKYLKKVLTGLSIAGLVTGISGLAISASG
jgi:radical SAM modification target selenobiotic family peptide